MAKEKSSPSMGSGAEEKFIQLFCDIFGPEKGQYVYLQHPFVDIYGRHRTIDFAINSASGKIAFEIDGTTWHDPQKVSSGKYEDDLLKQNSLVYNEWKVYRWTDEILEKAELQQNETSDEIEEEQVVQEEKKHPQLPSELRNMKVDYIELSVNNRKGEIYLLVPYDGNIRDFMEKEVANMFIPQIREGKKKMLPVSVMEEDHLIFIGIETFKIYENKLKNSDGIDLKKTLI